MKIISTVKLSPLENGFTVYKNENNKLNVFNKDGKIISPDLWFDRISEFVNGFARVLIDELGFNYISEDGRLVSPKQWFVAGWDFDKNGNASVWFNKKACLIDTYGNVIISTDYDHVETFVNGYARVCMRQNDEWVWNLINKEGNLVFDKWYKHVSPVKNGICVVTEEDGTEISNKLN